MSIKLFCDSVQEAQLTKCINLTCLCFTPTDQEKGECGKCSLALTRLKSNTKLLSTDTSTTTTFQALPNNMET